MYAWHVDDSSFNPCFGGEVVWTLSKAIQDLLATLFQSLFWWRGRLDTGSWSGWRQKTLVSILVLVERSFGPECGGAIQPGGRLFQSLFWWRGRLDRYTRVPLLHALMVSILVLVERSFGHVLVKRHNQPCIVSILVLVERSFGRPDADLYPTPLRGFNPCFGGEVVWTTITTGSAIGNCEFQSLFWWRGRLDQRSGRYGMCLYRFQSLFWWRGRLDSRIA